MAIVKVAVVGDPPLAPDGRGPVVVEVLPFGVVLSYRKVWVLVRKPTMGLPLSAKSRMCLACSSGSARHRRKHTIISAESRASRPGMLSLTFGFTKPAEIHRIQHPRPRPLILAQLGRLAWALDSSDRYSSSPRHEDDERAVVRAIAVMVFRSTTRIRPRPAGEEQSTDEGTDQIPHIIYFLEVAGRSSSAL